MEGEFDCLSSDKETSAVFYHEVKDTEVAESQECSGSFKMPQGHVLVFVWVQHVCNQAGVFFFLNGCYGTRSESVACMRLFRFS